MKKIFVNSMAFLLASVMIAGCLKTNKFYEGYTDIAAIADIPLSHLSSDTLTVYALDIAPSASATIDTLLAVHLSATNQVGDVVFKLGLGTNDPAYLKFMADNPEYTLMPANLYSFDSIVTIKNAGVLNTANVSIKFKTAAMDGSGNNMFISNEYVLPIIIKDAGPFKIASNFRMIMMRVLAKNKYDGMYSLVMRLTGWDAFGISDGPTATWPSRVGMVTAGANSLTISTAAGGANQPAFTTEGAITSFGATTPLYTFDPATNKLLSVSNTTPPDARNRALKINPAITDSRYDPANKTIYAAYIMTQTGRPNQFIYDTLTYKGPR